MQDLKSMTLDELTAALQPLGVQTFRAKQVYEWLVKGADSFDEMTNLSKDLRATLSQTFTLSTTTICRKLVSQIDGTVKYLFGLADGHCVEGVVMHYHHGHTLCLSTQVGCRMGCSFCATGMQGLTRNLTAGEMISQITTAQRDLNLRISHVVLMGMGEPLDNYQQTLRFLKLVTDKTHLNISARHISLSTCGVVDKIAALAQENLPITLSISLHAPNDTLRNTLMPINRKWNVDALLNACNEYVGLTGRRISFEYILIDSVNDTPACAKELANKLKGLLCHVNLIPANPVPGKTHAGACRQAALAFQKQLCNLGVNATIRRTLGSDINASCGQLKQTSER
ncbi:MAG: 23S rRNA (adenine(2503)-C(2))-methyltransferase RlmN [Clostridia bacterium]|nr:23S rRNA (adenine(2503)-C(2))-methyltransferase RlmN [Clostridia bacterium]